MKIKQTLIFIASLAVASIALNTSLYAQCAKPEAELTAIGQYCVDSYEQLVKETEEKEQFLAFVGLTVTGTPLWFFASSKSFSVFFRDFATGKYCTAPNYFGKIVDSNTSDTDLGEPT